jgi:3-methyladenine DNA glycosylase AlkD
MNFSYAISEDFQNASNAVLAVPMANYLKNKFTFFGIKTEQRRTIFKKNYEEHKLEIKSNFRGIAWELFQKQEREFHQCAIDLLLKEFKNNYNIEDIQFIEKLITTHSWWDSVDTIAKYILGGYLKQFPQETHNVIAHFSSASNLWLNRSAILFQLSYKEKTDFELLKLICEKHKHSKEFFIQKAIGWALRDYSRFNPRAVKEFVLSAQLKPLSSREALRLL